MACEKKEKSGACGHTTCPYYPAKMSFECVEVVTNENTGRQFCEVGEDCVGKCAYSFDSTDARECEEAAETFGAAYDIDPSELLE